MWESVPEGLPAKGWAELDGNGWRALIGWAAGPENLRRRPRQDDSARTVGDAHRRLGLNRPPGPYARGNAFRTRRPDAQVRGYLCFSDKTQCVPGTL